jgi:hypothetical protein
LFKSWQVFVFSLVFLAILFGGVIVGSMPGSDSELEVFPTQAPQPQNGAPAPTSVPGATEIQLVAVNIRWDKESLSAPAGQPVSVVMDNQDAGVLHNFSLYVDRAYSQSIFVGDIVAGPIIEVYNFDAPGTPGTYFFRCDVHPDTMTGQFTVN